MLYQLNRIDRIESSLLSMVGNERLLYPLSSSLTNAKRRRTILSPKSKTGRSQNQPLPKQQEQKRIHTHEAKTFGEAIQAAITIDDHLIAAEKFIWLPTDDNLQPHLRTQSIHHEKRRRWGSQLLEGLGHAALSSWQNDSLDFKRKLLSLDDEEGKIWTDARLVRAIMSVALPMNNNDDAMMDRHEKEGVWISAALKGLHVLSGNISPMAPSSSQPLDLRAWFDLHHGISMLIQSADEMSKRFTIKDAIEVRWAIRGLTARLKIANSILFSMTDAKLETYLTCSNVLPLLDFTTPNLNARTANLPFDVFSHCLPWQMGSSPDSNYYGYPKQDLFPTLLQTIPFNFDTLTTRTGSSVIERRGTAWLAEGGIGALAYSGKLMRPVEVPEIVRDIMRDVEQFCVEKKQSQTSSQSASFIEFKWDSAASPLCDELAEYLQPEYQYHNPTFFDCALCNHYPDGDAACKFHTDPEHGTHWHRITAVVGCGTSRIFAFRPIPDVNTWSEWDDIDLSNPITAMKQNENVAATLQLFPGDVVMMTGPCNDVFHHAVYSSPSDGIANSNSRVSLVFKRALDRGGGRRGHGLAGEGRRKSRQKKGSDYITH